MTLRLRLVLGLLVLMTVGLAIFGFSTYALYSRSEYDRLDAQLVNSIPLVTAQLYSEAGLAGGPPSPTRPERRRPTASPHAGAARHVRRAASRRRHACWPR